ncbi:MAG: hypothetical protein Q7J16_13425 [Candidatus Cloacimonadales bacterium]|nr:hypothetical protein [Candidatus Cloacimonadales bacterium]
MDFTFIIAIILFLFILFLIILHLRNKYANQLTNFKVYFYLGVVFIIMGIAMKFYVLSIIGLVFMIVGFANKRKWRGFEDWEGLSPKQRKFKITIVIILSVIFLYFSITKYWLRIP